MFCRFHTYIIYMRLHSVCSRSVCSRMHADGKCWCVAVCCSGGCVCVLASVATMVHCNTLPYTATHCNTLQHAATRNTRTGYGNRWLCMGVASSCALQRTAAHCNTQGAPQHTTQCTTHCTPQHTAPHMACRNALRQTWRAATHCNILQHTWRAKTYCNTLQHRERAATHCKM